MQAKWERRAHVYSLEMPKLQYFLLWHWQKLVEQWRGKWETQLNFKDIFQLALILSQDTSEVGFISSAQLPNLRFAGKTDQICGKQLTWHELTYENEFNDVK